MNENVKIHAKVEPWESVLRFDLGIWFVIS